MRHISELYSIHGGKLKKHIMIHPEDSESDEEDGSGLYAGGGGSGLFNLNNLGFVIFVSNNGASFLVDNIYFY